MELETRHAGHAHTANLKYGVIIFAVSVVYALIFSASHLVFVRKWASSGKAAPSFYQKLVSPRALPVHTLLWLAVIFGLLFHNFSIFTITTSIKRAGRLGFCLVPLDIVLALRPSLLATSYLDYIALHKWILRVLLFATTFHSLGYFAKWYLEGAVWQKSARLYNFLGVVAFAASVVLLFVSMRPLRNYFYKLFYVIHNLVILLFVSVIYWHARPGVGEYIFIALALLAYQIYNRVFKYHSTTATSVVTNEKSSLVLVRLDVPEKYPTQWAPGSHLRLSSTRVLILPSHPFTICSLPGNRSLDLVMKKGYAFQAMENAKYSVSSPFNSLPVPFFESTEHVSILCGGSGISLGLPLFRYFNAGSASTAKLTWATPYKEDTFILDHLQSSVTIDVYVTRGSSANSSATIEEQRLMAELIELEDIETDNSSKLSPSIYKVYNRRPNTQIFDALLEETVSKAIVVCGPEPMILEAKAWGKIHDVFVYSEFYSF